MAGKSLSAELLSSDEDETINMPPGRGIRSKPEALDVDAGYLFPAILLVTGGVISIGILTESYFQLTGSPFGLLKLAHSHGYLLEYKVSNLPNKGIWLYTGMAGSACFILMMTYSIRKRFGFMVDVGSLRIWLDVHMFLGIVGAALITAHTTLKIGGLVSISYWSMVLVASSGLVGRYLYGWIPHKVSGAELQIKEINSVIEKTDTAMERYIGRKSGAMKYYNRIAPLTGAENYNVLTSLVMMLATDVANLFRILAVWFELGMDNNIPNVVKRRLFRLIKRKNSMIRSINFFSTSRRLLHYWHVFHKPLAVMMFIVMFLHILVYILFRAEV